MFKRMVKELGGSSRDLTEMWKVVRWMMRNIYDPNTRERLVKILEMVEADIETVKGDVGKLQDNVSGEMKSWIA